MQPMLDNPQAVGQYLREVRESLGISVRQVADDLHIRLRYLEAMEAGNFESLPGAAYARGYVQKYADYLGVGGQFFLTDSVPAQATVATVTPAREFFIPTTSEKPKAPQSLWIGMVLVVVLLAYAIWSGMNRDAEVPIEQPKQVSAEESKALPPEMPADYQAFIPQVYALKGCTPQFQIEPEMICYWVPRSERFGLLPVQMFGAQIEWYRMEFAA